MTPKKIIGGTVGMGLPKPNLMQTDPKKGDYVKGKEEFAKQVSPDSGQNVDLTGYAKEAWVQEGFQPKGNYLTEVPKDYAKTEDIPTKPEDIGAQPAGNYLTSAPVASVNGKTGAVNLSASDVGARPNTWMPTAQEVGALPDTYTPPNQTAEQVGADPKGTAASAVSAHNTNANAHNDIRLLIEGLTTRLNALANSTDTDLDQMAELVAYIKSNKSLIDGITTSKVSVSDIINNLTTNVANKPLSAAQGVALKALIDGLSTGKLEASKLAEAISTALAQAKESGEFDGDDGYTPQRGVDYWTPIDKAEIEAYIVDELAKRGQLKPEFAQSLEWLKENGDLSKLYVLPDGYIYAYMEHTEEVVVPGKTVTVPGKAIIIKGYRYSHSGGSFSKHDTTTSIVFPIEVTEAATSANPVSFTLTNMLGHASYTGIYHGETNMLFTGNIAQRVATGNFTNFTSYGIPVGKWFVVFFVQYTGAETYADASFTYGDVTFTVGDNMEVHSDPSAASKAAHASTTTTEGTTETIVTKGFFSTGHKFVADIAAIPKPKSIALNNDIQPLESSISMNVPQLKKNKTIAFSGAYNGNLNEISIVQGEGTGFTECKCVVTATTITILKNNASVYTAEHGLTFGTYFSVVLATKTQNKTKAYLSSGGDTFTTGEFVWNASRSGLKLYTNVPFTQYRFAFGSNDFDKKIWMYGDSYLDHWFPVSISRGYTNCLADGYSGGGSSSGLASFKRAMGHGTPEKVVWCLGMNNGDKGAINQSWLDCITEVKGICEANNIELWVSTIPNTPTVDNTYKNAYIRESFDHVIDLSRLVGAEGSTAWYTGLLSSDNVHPSTEGDFYIANIMETYFPEMLDM